MKIAIHNSSVGYHPRWIAYCKDHHIPYKLVNCYATDIVEALEDCDILMWHHSHSHPQDVLIAKPLIFAILQSGKRVFPDFNTGWHFDDKVAQKYLLEALGVKLVPSYVFTTEADALTWTEKALFPKVFKLRKGAGSSNVQLVQSKSHARKLIRRAFKKGISQYRPFENLLERWRKYRLGKEGMMHVLKGIYRFLQKPDYDQVLGKERGYVYFQDFIPGNDHDIRVVVIDNKAFAIKRMTRAGDFRASGSGEIYYDRSLFDLQVIKQSFDVAKKIKSQCLAIDYVQEHGQYYVVEVSYGFSQAGYEDCPGYWNEDLTWVDGKFNPQSWMVELILR